MLHMVRLKCKHGDICNYGQGYNNNELKIYLNANYIIIRNFVYIYKRLISQV